MLRTVNLDLKEKVRYLLAQYESEAYDHISFFTSIVTLSAAGNSPTFRGFFIQGRLVADDSPVGVFVDPPAGVRLSSCLPPNVIHLMCFLFCMPVESLAILMKF